MSRPPNERRIDLLVVGRDVITMNARREIVAVGKAAELRARWPEAAVLGDPDAVITPGFVNGHHHLTGDRLVRSAIPDELAPGESIFTWAVPVHAAHSPDDDELSATIAAAELIENGYTTIVEAGTVAHPERVADGLRRVGARGTVGTWGWDVDGAPYAAPAAEVLARQAEVVDRFDGGPDRLVHGWVTLVGHDLMSDELLTGASELARSRGVGITFHISPHAGDAAAYLARTGVRPIVHFDRLGALGPHVLLAHAVHIDDAEVKTLLRTRTAVAYTPWAYLRLGQGVTAHGRHAELALAGGRIALGTDSENAGDAVDPLRVAAVTAGIAKDQAIDPTRFGAHDALELATIGGAEAIGMADRIGSLEVGKRADLVVHDTSSLTWTPRSADPVLPLVWAADGRGVREVVVDGRVVVRGGRCVTVDQAALRSAAIEAAPALLARAGIHPPSRWPVI